MYVLCFQDEIDNMVMVMESDMGTFDALGIGLHNGNCITFSASIQ